MRVADSDAAGRLSVPGPCALPPCSASRCASRRQLLSSASVPVERSDEEKSPSLLARLRLKAPVPMLGTMMNGQGTGRGLSNLVPAKVAVQYCSVQRTV
jgi:hypothetical protein